MHGSSSRYGDGDGSGYGDGYGDGYGYGSGDEPVGECGDYAATINRTFAVLRIGCEVNTLDEWIANAEEIDERHGDGIWKETRALAVRLKAAAPEEEKDNA